jgi:hypothetical protein
MRYEERKCHQTQQGVHQISPRPIHYLRLWPLLAPEPRIRRQRQSALERRMNNDFDERSVVLKAELANRRSNVECEQKGRRIDRDVGRRLAALSVRRIAALRWGERGNRRGTGVGFRRSLRRGRFGARALLERLNCIGNRFRWFCFDP